MECRQILNWRCWNASTMFTRNVWMLRNVWIRYADWIWFTPFSFRLCVEWTGGHTNGNANTMNSQGSFGSNFLCKYFSTLAMFVSFVHTRQCRVGQDAAVITCQSMLIFPWVSSKWHIMCYIVLDWSGLLNPVGCLLSVCVHCSSVHQRRPERVFGHSRWAVTGIQLSHVRSHSCRANYYFRGTEHKTEPY